MNRTQEQQPFARLAIVCAAIGFCAPSVFAAPYTFDLTNQVGDPFGGTVESPIDLGVTFSHIDSASIGLSGTFTPGLKSLFLIPPNSSPAVAHDELQLGLRLADENTSWFDKSTFAFQNLHGLSGQIDVVLPLTAVPPSPTLPVLFPAGGGAPDLGFLLDGRFALSTLGLDILAENYQELSMPTFSTSKISLIVEGTAVPEPEMPSFVAAILTGVMFCSKTAPRRCD